MRQIYVVFLLGFIMCSPSSPINSQEQKPEQKPELLNMVGKVPLTNVSGRIDHLAVDIQKKRLFVAALGNNTVEAIDLVAGKDIQTIKGLHEPQGVAFIPDTGNLYVANGEGGDCEIFETASFKALNKISLGDDADNVRYDDAHKQLLVGYSDGALAIIDLNKNQRIGEIKLAAHPESFQLEQQGKRVFVNVPGAGQVAVVDREKRQVIAEWRIKDAGANFPMALDEANHRLFIGCRKPAKLIIFDTDNGNEIARLDIAGDADDIFYDEQRRRIYVSGGEGVISVLAQTDANHYQLLGNVATSEGARTCLFVPELDRLYLAVPKRGGQPAEIRIYAPQK